MLQIELSGVLLILFAYLNRRAVKVHTNKKSKYNFPEIYPNNGSRNRRVVITWHSVTHAIQHQRLGQETGQNGTLFFIFRSYHRKPILTSSIQNLCKV